MIALAPYPQGLKLDQTVLSYYWNVSTLGAVGGQPAIHKKYQQAHDHYTQVRNWCIENLNGPYIVDVEDILYDGVRVRVGTEFDLAYFTLRWV